MAKRFQLTLSSSSAARYGGAPKASVSGFFQALLATHTRSISAFEKTKPSSLEVIEKLFVLMHLQKRTADSCQPRAVIAPGMGRGEPGADIRLSGGNSAAGIELVCGFGEIGCRRR